MRRIVSVLFFLLIGVSACSSVQTGDTKKNDSLPEIHCVVVLPVMIPIASSDNLTAAQKKNLEEGALFLDSVMVAELGDRPEFKILNENRLNAILEDPWRGRAQQVADISRATGCEVVLETRLSKYRERVGSSLSVETPAAAAFSMELIDVTKGVVLWTASFDESQKALSEDIFSFEKARKRGFKWLSVEQLSGDGLKSRLQTFPYFQKVERE